MNLQRLKFAYARGARMLAVNGHGEWASTEWDVSRSMRIHPDDAHLEYGPLSTALRDCVLWRREMDAEFGAAVRLQQEYCGIDEWPNWCECEQQERDAFLLLVAEALADEGL